MGNLGATVDEISWVVTSYIIANVIVIPMTSWLAGRFGRRRYFVGSIAALHGGVVPVRRSRARCPSWWCSA